MAVPSAGAVSAAVVPPGMMDHLDDQNHQEEEDEHGQQRFKYIVFFIVPAARFGYLSAGKGHEGFTGLYNASVIVVLLEKGNHLVPDNPGRIDVGNGSFESIADLDGYLPAGIRGLGFDEDHDAVVAGLAAHTPFDADPVGIVRCGAAFQVVHRHHGNLVGGGVVKGDQFPFQFIHLTGGKEAGKIVYQPLWRGLGRNGSRREGGCQHKQQEEQVSNLRHRFHGKKSRPEVRSRRRNGRGKRF